MILFDRRFIDPICNGEKTVTRRTGPRRWKVGSPHKCFTHMPWGREPGHPFAIVRIKSVFREEFPFQLALVEANRINQFVPVAEEAHREGFSQFTDFARAWIKLHGKAALADPCWRVEFELVEWVYLPCIYNYRETEKHRLWYRCKFPDRTGIRKADMRPADCIICPDRKEQ